MTKLMFDTHIFDKILETSLIDRLIELKSKRDIEYLITHVQIDEISAIGDDKKDETDAIPAPSSLATESHTDRRSLFRSF